MKNIKILHKPYGVYDRYNTKNYERFPKKPAAGEKIILQAVYVPSINNGNMILNYKINNTEYMVNGVKNVTKENIFYSFEIGPFNEENIVEYQFRDYEDKSITSEIFKIEILRKRYISKIVNITNRDCYIEICFIDNKKIKCKPLFIIPDKDGDLKLQFAFGSSENNSNSISIKEDDKFYYAFWEESSIIINKDTCKLTYKNKEEEILITDDNWISWSENGIGEITDLHCCFNSHLNEKYYGFGERYNSINQRGNMVDIYVYNQYRNQNGRTYIPVPFFISSAGYGLNIDSSSYIKFDMESTCAGKYSFDIEAECFSFTIIAGNVKKVIDKYMNITGKAEMMPKWAFGNWMSSNAWDNEKECIEMVEKTVANNIPANVFVVEAWSDEATFYIFNDAKYNLKEGKDRFIYDDFYFPKDGKWQNPKGFAKYLHENNMKLVLWQIPVEKNMGDIINSQKDIDEKYMIENGFCVKNPDDTPYRIPDGWFSDSLLLDFTNPKAAEWFLSKRRYLLEEVKADGFKTDGGEFVFGDDLKFFDGRTGKEVRNTYPNDYVSAYYKYIKKYNKGGITFSRAGFAGAQKYPVHWAGDEDSTFRAFRASIIAGLNAGLSGIIFWTWDLAGFGGFSEINFPTSELYIRAAEMSAFCPIMQYHAERRAIPNEDRTPWNAAERTGNEDVLKIFRYYANVRMNLMPYIYREAVKCCTNNTPLMRALVIDYSQDEMAQNIQDEYLFGDDLLAAPIVNEGALGRNVYLPEGEWVDLFYEGKLEKLPGKSKLYKEAGISKIPIYVKYNSVIPMNLASEFKLGTYIGNKLDEYENLCFKVYGDKISNYKFQDDIGDDIVINFYSDMEKVKIEVIGNTYPIYISFQASNQNITVNEESIKKYNILKNEKSIYIIRID